MKTLEGILESVERMPSAKRIKVRFLAKLVSVGKGELASPYNPHKSIEKHLQCLLMKAS